MASVMRPLARQIFSFPALLGLLLAVAAFVSARLNLGDPDTWWHLAVGDRILTTGTWPTTDPYSSTVAGQEWIAYEWLGEVLMAAVARAGAVPGLTALLVALSAVFLLLLFGYAFRRCGNSKAAFLATLLMVPLLVGGGSFTLRPQLLGYSFLVVALIVLESFRRGHRQAAWWLPPLFLVWVNTHGTFVFGLLAIGVYGLAGLAEFQCGSLESKRWTLMERRRGLASILLLGGALMVTPYGARVAAYPLQMALLQPVNTGNIIEWLPMPFDLYWGKYFFALILGCLLLQLLDPLPHRLQEVALLVFSVYAACVHRRFLFLFVVVVTPLLARRLARWSSAYQREKDRPAVNAVLMLFLASLVVLYFPSAEQQEEVVARRYPRDAVAYLRQHPVGGRLLNEYAWGGYLIWNLPGQRVFIDGRADLYEYAGVLNDYLDMARLEPNTAFLLRKYQVGTCLLPREHALATYLEARPDWRLVYSDPVGVVYVHQSGHPETVPE